MRPVVCIGKCIFDSFQESRTLESKSDSRHNKTSPFISTSKACPNENWEISASQDVPQTMKKSRLLFNIRNEA